VTAAERHASRRPPGARGSSCSWDRAAATINRTPSELCGRTATRSECHRRRRPAMRSGSRRGSCRCRWSAGGGLRVGSGGSRCPHRCDLPLTTLRGVANREWIGSKLPDASPPAWLAADVARSAAAGDLRELRVVVGPPVVGPLPHVAGHVVKAVPVGGASRPARCATSRTRPCSAMGSRARPRCWPSDGPQG
jgi:hypothetical protein